MFQTHLLLLPTICHAYISLTYIFPHMSRSQAPSALSFTLPLSVRQPTRLFSFLSLRSALCRFVYLCFSWQFSGVHFLLLLAFSCQPCTMFFLICLANEVPLFLHECSILHLDSDLNRMTLQPKDCWVHNIKCIRFELTGVLRCECFELNTLQASLIMSHRAICIHDCDKLL